MKKDLDYINKCMECLFNDEIENDGKDDREYNDEDELIEEEEKKPRKPKKKAQKEIFYLKIKNNKKTKNKKPKSKK